VIGLERGAPNGLPATIPKVILDHLHPEPIPESFFFSSFRLYISPSAHARDAVSRKILRGLIQPASRQRGRAPDEWIAHREGRLHGDEHYESPSNVVQIAFCPL
jgi:hypothetical protein